MKQQIDLEIRLALDSLHSAEEQVQVAREGLAQAQDELDRAQRRYQAGVASSLEVTDAQTRLARARDNHIAALRARALGIADAVALARKAQPGMRIEVEVTTVEEAREALAAGADELLLDNMSPAGMRGIVLMVAAHEPRPALEASGGITLANARKVAETGVDYISLGAITHSAKALDMSLEVEVG